MRKGTRAYNAAIRAKEAMLAAVSIFNNPLITFKSEACLLMVITAWTYLLQAYCNKEHIDLRKRRTDTNQIRYQTHKDGRYKLISLTETLPLCSLLIDKDMKNNLDFLIGLRNQIQHDSSSSIDEYLAPYLQANILNFRKVLEKFTDGLMDLETTMPLALQFAELGFDQQRILLTAQALDNQIKNFILEFEDELDAEELRSTEYKARVRLVAENKERGEDLRTMMVLRNGEPAPEGSIIALKQTEKPKFLPKQIVTMMNEEGYTHFTISKHTDLWKALDARDGTKGYGVKVARQWYWYEKWINEVVRPHCKKQQETIRKAVEER